MRQFHLSLDFSLQNGRYARPPTIATQIFSAQKLVFHYLWMLLLKIPLAGTSTQCHRNECDRCLKIGARPLKHMISFQCNKWLLLSTALSNWEICCMFFIDMQNMDREACINFPINCVLPAEILTVTNN